MDTKRALFALKHSAILTGWCVALVLAAVGLVLAFSFSKILGCILLLLLIFIPTFILFYQDVP
jgi:hypothetical protein